MESSKKDASYTELQSLDEKTQIQQNSPISMLTESPKDTVFSTEQFGGHSKPLDISKPFCDRLRDFEDRILENLDKITCPVHLSLGAEWVSEVIAQNIQKSDWLFSTHRNHGHYLAKGGSEDKLWDEICGLESGLNQGKHGSQSIYDPSINFYASSIVGGSIGVAVGAALANRGVGGLVVCVFGDAATEQGVFWESVNFCVLKQLPILFICENNGFSIDVPIRERQSSAIWWRVRAFGMRTMNLSAEAFRLARQEPIFCEARTLREGDHCYFPKRSTSL